jgi:hypothetical protein
MYFTSCADCVRWIVLTANKFILSESILSIRTKDKFAKENYLSSSVRIPSRDRGRENCGNHKDKLPNELVTLRELNRNGVQCHEWLLWAYALATWTERPSCAVMLCRNTGFFPMRSIPPVPCDTGPKLIGITRLLQPVCFLYRTYHWKTLSSALFNLYKAPSRPKIYLPKQSPVLKYQCHWFTGMLLDCFTLLCCQYSSKLDGHTQVLVRILIACTMQCHTSIQSTAKLVRISAATDFWKWALYLLQAKKIASSRPD